MAVGIVDQANGLRVDNGASRVVLYDANGNPITLQSGERPIVPRAIPIGGYNDGVFRVGRSDRFGNLAVATHSPLFSPDFEGSTQNVLQWASNGITFAPTQTTGAYNFNPTASTTASAQANIISLKRFKKMQRAPVQAKFRLRHALFTNSSADWGFGVPNGTAAITSGVYFQITNTLVIQGMVTINSFDVPAVLKKPNGDNLLYTDLASTAYYTYDILVDDDEARFIIQNTETEAIIAEGFARLPVGQARLMLESHLPIYTRLFNTATVPSTAPVLILTDAQVTMLDSNPNRPWGHTLHMSGFGTHANPLTGASVVQFANSAAPTNATLSNVVAGYTTLGGLFAFAAPAGAATDYSLFAFTVPAPYQLVITGIAIDTYNDGAAVATTGTNLIWGLSTSTAVSLASTTHRTTVGNQSFAVGAAIGATAQRLTMSDAASPLFVIDQARVCIVSVRVPVGTATASQVIRGNVALTGYFE